ncbi:MAG TPA: hypothetical protein VJ717_01575 [Gemmatimonadaceae bacterium]|nr:hypothetical protein [Gemmatimonadaceae bacterium]
MLHRAVLPLLLCTCRIVNEPDLPDPPAFRITIEPDTVRAGLNVQAKLDFRFLIRIFNDGPGMLFVPPCGHELQRSAPNASWTTVYEPPCPTGFFPPFAVDAGGTYGYVVRIVAPVDSGPWRRGEIGGRYRMISYISAEYRDAGRWGRPVPHSTRISPEFPVREEIP